MKKSLLTLGGLWLVGSDAVSFFLVLFHPSPALFSLGLLGLADIPLFLLSLIFRNKNKSSTPFYNTQHQYKQFSDFSPDVQQDLMAIQQAIQTR
ncbi:MAG: hypothetical protein COX39_00805 [Candidatus Nealsonbacteria bacterium CG23_combo_of_CG06-09_8_20_14_all_40_13]|uniref:Uncharacterized protein n=1 Tax=Candidatus Nealsonbacteria bacterium CG23_combo_of_CG06-09_8_20_14_all_40_13 TaxID=1974724 RepID=A0A2G9YSV9_9BACT|nr:MAG: hypothetical protein COX39_00805 [Candidatus Nealsonbacteria bacterium CG23_combo_of_CG06-09_8_20_14_all_40_13]